jgi:TPR repeat protein
MNARAAIAVVVLIVVMGTVVSVVHHRRAALASIPTAASVAVGHASAGGVHGESSSTPSEAPAALPAAPSREMIGRDSDAAARLWLARADQVLLAKDRKEYGADVARLLRLNPDQAWRELTERVNAGDLQAAAAAVRIASLCMPFDEAADAARRPTFSRLYPDLQETWKSFLGRLDAIQKDMRRERASHCEGVGKPDDAMDTLFDLEFRAENPEARIGIAAQNKDDAEAIADLRKVAADTGLERAKFVLGDRLLVSQDPAEQAEGRALLEHVAPNDPLVAVRLGHCLADGCEAFPADPPAARAWFEQAAGAGDEFGLILLTTDLDASGEKVAAWAWSLYALDLAISGCFETISPSYRSIAFAAQDEARRRSLLSPAEQNAGLAMSYAIFGRWERQAKERLSCAD